MHLQEKTDPSVFSFLLNGKNLEAKRQIGERQNENLCRSKARPSGLFRGEIDGEKRRRTSVRRATKRNFMPK